MSQQHQHSGKSLFTRIEKLIDQILLVSDVPCQQICHEHVGKRVFPVKNLYHGLLIDSHHRAIGHCGYGEQAESLPCKATFSEEVALVQNAYHGFLPALRHDGESYLSFLYVKNGIGQVTLNKDRLFLTKRCDFSPAIDGRKKCLGIEFAEFLSRHHGCSEPPKLSVCCKKHLPVIKDDKCARRARTISGVRAKLRSA